MIDKYERAEIHTKEDLCNQFVDVFIPHIIKHL